MIIDFHTHVLPPEDQNTFTAAHHERSRSEAGPCSHHVENVLEAQKIGASTLRNQQPAAILRHGS
jgi:hypothetical protein